jgi:hypothetical protein
MTAREVVDLLGAPVSKFPNRDGSETWAYDRHTWAIYYVYLGPDGTVVRFNHDF